MSLIAPRLRRVALAGLVPAIAGAALVAPSAHAATPTPEAKPSKTTVTLDVKGCNGCDLRLVQASEDDPSSYWHSHLHTVKDGKVSWTVLTSRTIGMSIEVRAPWDGGTDSVPNVVFRYAGKKVGDPVSATYARHARRAAGCYAGTTTSDLGIAVTVVHAKVPGVTGKTVTSPRAFTSVTQPSKGGLQRAPYGTLGNQDAYYC